MPEFNIPFILLSLLGGFVFVTNCNRTKWYAVRAEKERLTLVALIAGFIHLGLAWIVTLVVSHVPCVDYFWCFSNSYGKWQQFWNHIRPFPHSGTAILAFVFAGLTWIPLNQYCFEKANETFRIIVKEGGPLEQLLDHAMYEQKHVMVTLKNDKVYIGRLDSSFTPGQLSRTIRILPSKSGYRQTVSKRVVINIDYDKIYKDIADDFKTQGRADDDCVRLIEDFFVVVALDDIASISLHWETIDARYFKKTVARTTALPTFRRHSPPKEQNLDPLLRLAQFVGGRTLVLLTRNGAWTKTQSTWKLVVGATVILGTVIIILYGFSN